ncbi:MAG: type II secretion system F family protein [Gemmatimonadaceae bacterium]
MFSALSPGIVILVVLFAAACGVAITAVLGERDRRMVLRRATRDTAPAAATLLLRPQGMAPTLIRHLVDWLAARVPARIGPDTISASRLVQAGFDEHRAPAIFAVARISLLVILPTVVLLFMPRADPWYFFFMLGAALFTALFGPTAYLDRAVARRQAVIRAGVPDALDLLVVCVEAGVALDAAMQRVGRELVLAHPLLANEMLAMTRRVAAGMARDQAMHSLYIRTGIEELRTLMTHLVQSERWGTSVASVLRVYARDLRRKRRQAAEKRAATASTRMLAPLALFIFPTIFVVVLGPAMLQILAAFKAMD